MQVPTVEPTLRVGLISSENYVVREVSGDSRHDYLAEATRRLCELANVRTLDFLHSASGEGARWKLALGIEDGEDEIYGYVYGFLLEGAELVSARAGLDAVMSWARDNLEKLDREWIVGDFADEKEAREAIEMAERELFHIADYAWHAEDGDGPGFLFAYLASANAIAANAIAIGHPVLHVRQKF